MPRWFGTDYKNKEEEEDEEDEELEEELEEEDEDNEDNNNLEEENNEEEDNEENNNKKYNKLNKKKKRKKYNIVSNIKRNVKKKLKEFNNILIDPNKPTDYYYNSEYYSGILHYYLIFTSWLRDIVENDSFNYFILFVIVIAGINIGIQTYPELDGNVGLSILDTCILIIFSLEAIMKILSEGLRPHIYFTGPDWKWNCFDFTIVFMSLPFWNGLFGGGSLALLRLVRLMRLGKLIKKVPQLQMIVQGLTGGLASIGYIMILLFLVFYLFAIAGVLFFRANDPFHFGSLIKALITCFVCATLDSWSTIMYINIYGCEKFPDIYSTFESLNKTAPDDLLTCTTPKPQFAFSAAYFIILVVMTALVMLSLFIGAVTLSMQDSLDELKEIATEKVKQEKIKRQLAKMFQSQKINTRSSVAVAVRRLSKMNFNVSSFKLNTSRPESPEIISGSGSSSSKLNPIKTGYPRAFLNDMKIKENNNEDSSSSSSIKSPSPGINHQSSMKMIQVHPKANSFSGDNSGSGSGSGSSFAKRKPSMSAKLSRGKSVKGHDLITPELLKQMAEETASGESDESRELSRKLRIALGELSPSIKDEPKTLDLFISRLKFCQNISEVILLLAEHCKWIADHPKFVGFVTFVIILAGLNVGAQTDSRITGLPIVPIILRVADVSILTVFTIECVLKIFGEVPKPWIYFEDNWNKFDFLIVVGSYTPGAGSILTILRLLRLLRVLKLVKSLPQLAVIVDALMMGIESIGYIGLILFLCFYVFAIIGMMLFRNNDPFNFGSLHISMFTLFRCSTLDAWADLLYINMYGCDSYPGGTYSSYPELCTQPSPQGILAVLYFISFVVIGAQILLTLFIGVVTTSMEEAQTKQTREAKIERQLTALKISLDLSPLQITMFKEAFNTLDLDQGGFIEHEEIAIGLAAIKDIVEGTNIQAEIEKADPNNNGIDLVTFIVILSSIPTIKQKRLLRKTVKRWLANKRKRGLFFRESKRRKPSTTQVGWMHHTWSYLFGNSGKNHLSVEHMPSNSGTNSSEHHVKSQSSNVSHHLPNLSNLLPSAAAAVVASSIGISNSVSSSFSKIGSTSFHNNNKSYDRLSSNNGSGGGDIQIQLARSSSPSSSTTSFPNGRRGTMLRLASTNWIPQSDHEVKQAVNIQNDLKREDSELSTFKRNQLSPLNEGILIPRQKSDKYQADDDILDSPTFVRDFNDPGETTNDLNKPL